MAVPPAPTSPEAGEAMPSAAEQSSGMSPLLWVGLIVAVAVAVPLVLAFRHILGIRQRPCWPPPDGAVTPEGARAATEALVETGGSRPHGDALDFAWSTAATIEPWPEGATFFPRILADIEAAQSSVHILMFGWKNGEIGLRMAALLERKLAEGVEVRVIVDRLGSRPFGCSREMFTRLAAAGAEIAINDVLPLDRDGLFPDGRRFGWRQNE